MSEMRKQKIYMPENRGIDWGTSGMGTVGRATSPHGAQMVIRHVFRESEGPGSRLTKLGAVLRGVLQMMPMAKEVSYYNGLEVPNIDSLGSNLTCD